MVKRNQKGSNKPKWVKKGHRGLNGVKIAKQVKAGPTRSKWGQMVPNRANGTKQGQNWAKQNGAKQG